MKIELVYFCRVHFQVFFQLHKLVLFGLTENTCNTRKSYLQNAWKRFPLYLHLIPYFLWFTTRKFVFSRSFTDLAIMFCLYHGTIMWTGITCKNIPCCMGGSFCRWFVVKKAKIFSRFVKHFWILAGVRKCKILIGLCK